MSSKIRTSPSGSNSIQIKKTRKRIPLSRKKKLVIKSQLHQPTISQPPPPPQTGNKVVDIVKEPIYDNFDKIINDIKGFDKWYNNHDKELQKLLLEFQNRESIILGNNPDKLQFLYPHLLDPNFNIKIAEKKEFNDLVYDTDIKDVEEEADLMCSAGFEISPHQIFVRNFLSSLTPYNSLLLYHGLGTGKTCSAISVCEEMRDYMNQVGIQKKIIIVASPNVQSNFRLQLFDDRKLKEVNGLWDLKACTGNKLLKEINPMNMKGLSKVKIVKQVNKIINKGYVFMGYIEFSNYITKLKSQYLVEGDEDQTKKNKERALKREFSNRLIVIDEVHNIRISGDNPNKKIAQNLLDMVNYSDTLKLLLLSATPMFNSYKEIVWLINLMNINDGRPKIEVRDIFDKKGNFRVDGSNEVGKNLLLQKMRGYVSFVRGENPYTFPYRIYPSDFNKLLTLKNPGFEYPKYQLNGSSIIQGIEYLDIFINKIGNYQKIGYDLAKQKLKSNLPDEVTMDKGMGWTNVELPLQTLNFVYPNSRLDEFIENPKKEEKIDIRSFIGRQGLLQVVSYNDKTKRDFEYKQKPYEKYGNIFSSDGLQKYSMKLHNIMGLIKKSKGIVLLYSQYIDGGCVPIALALEELGITRLGNDNLFKTEPTPKIDSNTMKAKTELDKDKDHIFNPARYIMITGDSKLSPNNLKEIKSATNEDNVNGEKVKVIIISKAGSEGIDLNNIRQVHIIEPWYNMSRTDQIIGRAVRFRSHCRLPFAERNVEIYLHGSIEDKKVAGSPNEEDVEDKYDENDREEETIDMYIYRMAEKKSIQMGNVSRVMKENAIDCYLNEGLNNLTERNMKQTVKLSLSTGYNIDYNVGDKKFTQICDYMEKCDFTCKPEIDKSELSVNMDSYNENFIILNIDKIISNIKELFKDRYLYKKDDLIKLLTHTRKYPLIQINKALDYLINERNEYIIDMLGRLGHLENINEMYFFKPIELETKHITIEDMNRPFDYKHKSIKFNLQDNIMESSILENIPKKIVDKDKKGDAIKENISGVLKKLLDTYYLIIETKDVIRGDNDWFKHCGVTIQKLSAEINLDILNSFALHHLIDIMDNNDKMKLIEYLNIREKIGNIIMDDIFFEKIENYINKTLLIELNESMGGAKGYLLENKNAINLYVLNSENILERAKPTDIDDFREELQKKILDISQISDFVGFMMAINKSGMIIFKTKNMLDKRSRGARCDQAGKKTQLKILNQIYGETEKYTSSNSKDSKIPQLCSEQEFLLRYYDGIRKDGKKWFFNYENALFNKIDKN